jgi:hypothetical protein
MEQQIKNVESEFDKLGQNPTEEEKTAFKKAVNELNEIVKDVYFAEKKSYTFEVINYHLNTLKRQGSLIVRNQSTTSDNYYLGKVWGDIRTSVINKYGYGRAEILVYSEPSVAEKENCIKYEIVIEFLTKLIDDLEKTETYADLLILIYNNQNNFLNLDIKLKD